MAYLIVKVALLALVLSSVAAIEEQHEQYLPQSDTFSKYQALSCCPAGYNAAGQYCVKCNAPKHWDPITQKCVVCEPGHTWDELTHECSCCEAPRSVVNGVCSCPAPKTQWDANNKQCVCPPNTFGNNC